VKTKHVADTIAFVMNSFEIIKFVIETLLAISAVVVAMFAYFQGKKSNEKSHVATS